MIGGGKPPAGERRRFVDGLRLLITIRPIRPFQNVQVIGMDRLGREYEYEPPAIGEIGITRQVFSWSILRGGIYSLGRSDCLNMLGEQ